MSLTGAAHRAMRGSGRDLVPARKHGWVTAHQHFGDLDRNAVVDVLGSRPAAQNEKPATKYTG